MEKVTHATAKSTEARGQTLKAQENNHLSGLILFCFCGARDRNQGVAQLDKLCTTGTQPQPRKETPESRAEGWKASEELMEAGGKSEACLGHMVKACVKRNKWIHDLRMLPSSCGTTLSEFFWQEQEIVAGQKE